MYLIFLSKKRKQNDIFFNHPCIYIPYLLCMGNYKSFKKMKYFLNLLSGIVLLSMVFFALQRGGIFWPQVVIDRGAWRPDMGYGSTDIFVWDKCNIVYHDTYKWTPSTKDSLELFHLKAANSFIQTK